MYYNIHKIKKGTAKLINRVFYAGIGGMNMLEDYVYVGSNTTIKLASKLTDDDKGIVYMGRFLSYEEAKMYHESCTGEKLENREEYELCQKKN